MKRSQVTTLIALFLAVIAGSTKAAQEGREVTAPTGLTLEVTYLRQTAPSYTQVPGPEAKAAGAWYALFGRVPARRRPADALPVRAVNVVSRQESGAVKVRVFVFTGIRFHEKEELVAAHRLRENEKFTVGELADFGVEPFEIKVIRLNPTPADLPAVTNNTQSLAVTQIAHNSSTLPSYRLSLHNLAAKDVIAIGIYVLVDGQRRLSSVPQGREGRPLIAAGATYQQHVANATDTVKTGGAYAPHAPRNQEVVITVAVFADGSYEGDAGEAAKVRAFFTGRRIQVARIVELLREASGDAGRKPEATLAKLKTSVSALGDRADASVADKLLAEFPALNGQDKERLAGAIEVSLNGVKRDLLNDIERFERTGTLAPKEEAVTAWLNAAREMYERWLSRL